MGETQVDQLIESSNCLKRKRETAIQPRWYNQSYLLFLALRQAPNHSLSRLKLIEKAIELDKKIGNELQLPRVFRGKTPKNSASATLTNNSDRYFVSHKPEGSRNTHFKLAYEPGNVDEAVEEYRKWCKKLVEHDWPFCFGVPKEKEPTQHYHTPTSHPEEDHSHLEEEESPIKEEEAMEEESKSESSPMEEDEDKLIEEDSKSTEETTPESTKQDQDMAQISQNLSSQVYIERYTSPIIPSPPTAPTPTTTTTRSSKKDIPPEPFIALDELDLSNIPSSWRDIVRVAPSNIPGGGNGLFATRRLPYNTPIGFYFGVPMSEDEFDALKDRVGRSSEYSIMYRRTVLDATDESGEPVLDTDSPRFCPFHFMNETGSQKTASVAFVEGALVNQIICWTKKVIEKDEELLVWYGKDVHRYWSEEELEANRKKQVKQQKVMQVQERKQGRSLKKQEKLRLIEENRKRRELARAQKLEEERLRKLKREEEKRLKKLNGKPKKEKKPAFELETVEEGEFRIKDETLTYFTKEEFDALVVNLPKKQVTFVIATPADMESKMGFEIEEEEEAKTIYFNKSS